MMLACSNAQSHKSAAVNQTAAAGSPTTQPAGANELPLPAVPASLRDPAQRANYIIEHFWDAMQFADTLRSRNAEFMEQNFVNFISVFPYAEETSRESAVANLMRQAQADSSAYVLLADIAERYLYDPNSPMLSEDFYILFLEELSQPAVVGEYGCLRYRYQLQAARKNQPGMKAADFRYTTRDGKGGSLYRTKAGERLLLIFYDPECESCHEVMGRLQQSPLIAGMVAGGSLQVLAVSADVDRETWLRDAAQMPEEWTVALSVGEIYERELYSLRAMPTMFLLDADKRVIAKDILANQLEEYLMTAGARQQ